jgi:hypothetical protein
VSNATVNSSAVFAWALDAQPRDAINIKAEQYRSLFFGP